MNGGICKLAEEGGGAMGGWLIQVYKQQINEELQVSPGYVVQPWS